MKTNLLESSLTSDASVEDFIADNPLFYSLPKNVVSSIAPHFQSKVFETGNTIIQEGQIGDSFFLIRKGRVQVVRTQGEEELVLSELGSGDGFGEMALLIDQPRSATVKALGEVETLILNRQSFASLARSLPPLAEKFNKLLAERVSLLEGHELFRDTPGKFRASRSRKLDYANLDLLTNLNEAAGGREQVEHCRECGKLAREMSKMLCPMVSEELFFAGYLHEIGKVSMSRDLVILERRGGQLADADREGFVDLFHRALEILTPNPDLYEAVSFLPYLSQTDYREMPLEAQILKVADDYLTLAGRHYLNLGIEAALARISEGSGTLYNPRVVAALHKNIRRFNEVQVDSQLSVLRMMVIALDKKDNYTYRHSMDVRDMALKIVHRLGLGRREVEYARIGSELHDVGKIFIDASILNAPRKLTTEEYDIMKTHASRSSDFLNDIPGMDELASIVRAHHERFDGTGYPDGLAAQDIPYLARVMALADVWSALTTPRVYRLNDDGTSKAFEPARAYSIMTEMNERGHFDPELFPVFSEIVGGMLVGR